MAIYREDIIDIELESGTVNRSFMLRSIGNQDNNANAFGVRLFRNSEPVDVGAGWVQGFFRNSQGQNIALMDHGVIDGNKAYVILPQACYNYDGPFTLAIKIVSEGSANTVTMRIVDGVVDNTNTGSAVAPTETVPTYQEILAVYEQMVATLSSAVRYDVTQSLTDAQKAKARENIGAGNSADISKAVRWDVTQSLTNAQKQRARENIGAATSQDFDSLGLYIADGYICQDITSD